MQDFFALDFQQVKENLKTYLKSKDRFKDYNFEGSALANLVDLLAYMTFYNGSYLNFSVNELFMKNAQIPNNIYKLAHMLNYVPKRKVSPSISVMMKSSTGSVYVPAYTQFLLGDSIKMTIMDDITVGTTDTEVQLYEGEFVVEEFISDGSENQQYELQNRENIDNSFFWVFVNPYLSGSYVEDVEPWTVANMGPFSVNGRHYFLAYFDKVTIKFDTGKLFQKPSVNDKVVVKYLKTNGSAYNGITSNQIRPATTFTNSNLLTITTTDTLKNGVDEETFDEIKANAPLYYTTQSRAVTEADYNIIIKTYPKNHLLKDSFVWSGHREFVSISDESRIVETEFSGKRDLGYSYMSAIKNDYSYLNSSEISELFAFFDPFKYLMTFHKFLQPTILFIEPQVTIKFKNYLNVNLTDIRTYIENYLNKFIGYNKKFSKSNLIRHIDQYPSVDYIDVTYTTHLKVHNTAQYKVFRVWEPIVPGSLSGSVNGNILQDSNGSILVNGVNSGVINYSTGFMQVNYDFGPVESYEVQFEFDDKLSFSILRETFMNYRNLQIQII